MTAGQRSPVSASTLMFTLPIPKVGIPIEAAVEGGGP